MDSAAGKPASSSDVSGKLVIVGILVLAVVAAATSWWFRYHATHRAAEFWGANVAALIRDASQVTLHVLPMNTAPVLASPVQSGLDVSQAQGLTHLRNALLEDHNFIWPAVDQALIAADETLDWKWILKFRDPNGGKWAAIQFTKDCTLAARVMSSKERGSVRPTAARTAPMMTKGLREMFTEFTAASSADAGAKPQAANEAADPVR
jgi:hypothetical protein